MLQRDEVESGLTKMGVASTRRIGIDQMDKLITLWVEQLAGVEPVAFRRAAHAYVQEGKWPAVGEFRTRAAGLAPIPPGAYTPSPADEEPRCPAGHLYTWRLWTNMNGIAKGARAYCRCADRAARLYGEVWGAEVADGWVPEGYRESAKRVGSGPMLEHGDAWEGDD